MEFKYPDTAFVIGIGAGVAILAVTLVCILSGPQRWLEWFEKLRASAKGQMVGSWAKAFEVFAVLIGVLVLVDEFRSERPKQRAIEKSRLFAQIVELSPGKITGGGKQGWQLLDANSSTIKTIMEAMASHDISMKGLIIPPMIYDSKSYGVRLSHANLAGADLTGADLSDANLNRAHLNHANLADADLADANLNRAHLNHANLADADLADANLARADLTGADLADADLVDADLFGANLADANLADADLVDADLFGANLADANLARADLTGADLADADLTRANLARAYLARAYLADSNLSGVNGLTQDMLKSARPSSPPLNLPEGLVWPFEKDANGGWELKK